MYSDDIIVVLTPDKNILKIEDYLLNAINAVLAPSWDQAGFSRRLIWLEISSTNKILELNPKINWMAVKQLKGVPKLLKADDGTEHSIIEPLHVYFSELNGSTDPIDSFSIIPSPRNKRIAAYWSNLRKDRLGWWKSFFQDMIDLDIFNPVHVNCIRYCLMNILREEMKRVATQWNQHILSKSQNGGPCGRPDAMNFLPHLYEAICYIQ